MGENAVTEYIMVDVLWRVVSHVKSFILVSWEIKNSKPIVLKRLCKCIFCSGNDVFQSSSSPLCQIIILYELVLLNLGSRITSHILVLFTGKCGFWILIYSGACGLSPQRTKPNYFVQWRGKQSGMNLCGIWAEKYNSFAQFNFQCSWGQKWKNNA